MNKFRLFAVIFSVGFVIFLYNMHNAELEETEIIIRSHNILSYEKFDWHDYAQMSIDSARIGFGEHGAGEKLTDPADIAKNDEMWKEFGMSVVVSDKMSVNRSIPDFRHPNCHKRKYFRHLPRVSIVIIFHNEIFSVFKRTLHSLYNRTPHELIEEIILVNDNSTLDYLYDPLEQYIKENFPAVDIRIINLKKRHGAMKARIEGVKQARSEFIFMSEPHCEMTYNWLPPLIEPVFENARVVTIPIIDHIEYNALHHYANALGNTGSRGAFNWKIEYNQLPRLPLSSGQDPIEPFENPVMTGGLYLIRRKYFFEIGPYDEGAIRWGAEGFEMSLKIWLCGGRMLEVPCSRVGHIFRAFNKYRHTGATVDFVAWNNKRLAEIWFGDYKQYVYMRNPARYKLDVGDISEELKLKERLKCKPFQYFLDVVAPDLIKKFPPFTPSYAYGSVKLANTNYCLDSYQRKRGEPLGLFQCGGSDPENPQDNQNFEITIQKELRFKFTETCLDGNDVLVTSECSKNGKQMFFFEPKNNLLLHVYTGKCLEANIEDRSFLKFSKCDLKNRNQMWNFGFINETAINTWRNEFNNEMNKLFY